MATHFGDLPTVEQFLRFPECRPPLEFVGGRVIQKLSCGVVRSLLRIELATMLDGFARSRKVGRTFLGLRSTFGGGSLVPDVSYYSRGRLPKFKRGEEAVDVLVPPDIAAEISDTPR